MRLSLGLIVGVVLTAARLCWAQAPALALAAALDPAAPSVAVSAPADPRWDITLDGFVGAPIGHLRVGESPTGANKLSSMPSPGTNLRLHDLGVDVSEAVQATIGFHFTAKDAVRLGFLYYFLRGSTTPDHPIFYNGPEFTPGSVDTNADFYRLSLDYERTLLSTPAGELLIASVGLTYVDFNPTLTGSNQSGSVAAEGSGRSNSEDFYRQELPVPIAGVQWEHPLRPGLRLRAVVSGGGLPRVNSGRGTCQQE